MNDDKRIGAAIRRIREGATWSQGELAALMRQAGWTGWRQTTVSRVEAGTRPLRFAEAIDLADLLGEDIDTLAGGLPVNILPRRKCTACGHIKDHVTYDLRAHDFRCADCREPRWDRFTTWEDIDAAEETA